VRASTHPDFEVAVVDNGSSPRALAELEAGLATRPGVALVRVSPNRGYTGGMNAAFAHVRASEAPYVWLLADDVTVEPGAMTAFVDTFAAQPRAGVAGAMTLHADEPARIWFAGGVVEPLLLGRAIHRGLDTRDDGLWRTPDRVDFANGSCLFALRAVVEAVGGFDEAYFTYWEDVDWCARVAAAGHEVWFVPTARIRHAVTPDTGDRLDRARRYDMRNRLIWHRRHRPKRVRAVFLWSLVQLPRLVLLGRAHEASLMAQGLWAWCRGRTGRFDA
jgi:GT2 family glycosyltransferase